jgi:hypothetical protein
MRAGLFCVLCGLAGCDALFGLDHLDDADAQRGGEGSVMDDGAGSGKAIARFDFEGNLVEARSMISAVCVSATTGACDSFVTGVHGLAFDLDGISDCIRFMLPSNPTELTVAVWVRKNMDNTGSVVAKPWTGSSFDSWQIDTDPNRTVRFTSYDGTDKTLIAEGVLGLNVWQHIAVTLHTSKRIFINGVPTTNEALNETFMSDGSAMFIGCDRDGAIHTRLFYGSIDEVLVFDSVLSDAQIAALAVP